ncbi:hypothetical protein XM53_08460 [Roseovarius atlanticus]|uniref:DUF6647 domain-containing protein n=1 Tax=Roseovarius atlanticus TaxID=1641875 RepID=A0A0T5NWM3_9RHOB|nr:DUF6647 family protein [Roseovarius atlanticus]KRS13166.1 hypothetical protein XM53_08460 [Roseovarius atlanticus]
MRILSRAGLWSARNGLFCLVLNAFCGGAWAADLLAWREAQAMPDLVEHMEVWLDRHTDLPRRAVAPEIRLTSTATVARLAPMRAASDASHTRGLYDPDSETIWLVRPWNAKNPYDVSVLLHELVHHRQAVHGHWYCPGAQELPAYRAQQAWLNALGLEPDVNWVAVVLESGCTTRDIHPE